MNNFEKLKSMNTEELTDWIDKYGQLDNSPWIEWFDKTYCKNCESIKCHSKQYNYDTEVSYAYCELHDNCKFFPDLEYVPELKDVIKMWLESEVEDSAE